VALDIPLVRPFMYRETVAIETFAARATSSMVATFVLLSARRLASGANRDVISHCGSEEKGEYPSGHDCLEIA
jgi:hypothetical protein